MTAAAPAASPAPPQILLAHHLRQLKLPTFLREYEKVAAEAAREGLDHVRFLLRLAELELIDRERRMVERRIRAAHFSAVKSFDTFDFTAIPSLNKPLTLELARCEYLIARDNVIALGNSGTGKTHACLALGLAACQRGFPVSFFTAAGLVHQLMEARDERRLLKLQAQLASVKLLIVDELGYVPLSQTGAELLFEIFSQRHERGSTIVTSNLPFEEWTSVFGNQRLTGALLDRLTHHVHILELNGESYRLKQSKARRRRALDPPMRSPQPPIPKPAKSSQIPESHGRPGYETPAISAGAAVARRARCPRRKLACFCSAQMAGFTPPLTLKKRKYIARRPMKGNTRPHVRSWSAPLIRSLSPSATKKAAQTTAKAAPASQGRRFQAQTCNAPSDFNMSHPAPSRA